MTGSNTQLSSRRISSERTILRQSSTDSGRQQLRQPLLASLEGAQFLDGLTRLVSSKRTLDLTDHQAETWLAALSLYAARPQIVNKAIVQLAVDPDPFPDLSKLLEKCERIRREEDMTLPKDAAVIRFSRVKELAKAWGLEIG
jgi:hypothetical protein